MIRRLFVFVIVTALVVSAAVWLADRPGEVTLRWQGWRVDTSVPVLVATVALLVLLIEAVLRVIRTVTAIPGRIVRGRRERRQRDGYRALSDGLAAIATGNPRAAGKLAKRADRLLADNSLTGLLTAQAAELSGDQGEAERRLSAMLARPETAFLGLKGLTALALKRGDHAAALDTARRAWALDPSAAGLAATLFDLQARAGQWSEAEITLAEAKKRRALGGDELSHRLALVLLQRAGLTAAEGDAGEAARLALRAHEADKTLVPAAAKAAEFLHRIGKDRKAGAVLLAGWKASAHPDLVEGWLALAPAETALARTSRLEALVRANPHAAEGHLALATAALAAKLWGKARSHAEASIAQAPSRAAFTLLAAIERDEKGDEAAAQSWLAKAASAPGEARWLCSACGQTAERWSVGCPSCGGIDSQVWRVPSGGVLAVS